MPNGDRPTDKQHFIPRVYLKEFSEIKRTDKVEKAFIWQFDLKRMKQIPAPVNIADICYEKNLYELRDEKGNFFARNIIEKTYEKIERAFGGALESIKRRTQDEKCLFCTTFLSEEEKNMLIIFITTLMYRDPVSIGRGIAFLHESNPDMSDIQRRNFTILNLLPLGLNPEWDQKTVSRTALDNLSNMAFQIGIASDNAIFTSDNPIVLWSSHNNECPNRPEAVAFPLTSRLVLYLFPLENLDSIGSNYLFQMDEERVQEIQMNIAICAKRWIYSREKLTDKQVEQIKEARARIRR